MVDDQRQALPREGDLRPRYGAAGPGLDVDPAVAVGDHRREPVLQRLVFLAADRRPVVPVAVDEAAVEGREQAPALSVGHRHRPAHRRVRRLVAARVEGRGGPRVIEPRDVRHDPWVVDLRPELRDEGRRAPADERSRSRPLPLTAQRMREDGLDRRRRIDERASSPVDRSLTGRHGNAGESRQLRAALLRGLPAVVVVLDLIDEPVAMMGPQPLDAARPERQARRLHHRRRVGVDGGRNEGETHDRHHEPDVAAPLPAAAAHSRRLFDGAGGVQACKL